MDLLDHDDASFISFLKNLEDSHEKIILLGDIIETLMPKIPMQYDKAFWGAWYNRRKITSRFETNQYTYVYGNHDWIAGKLVHAKERLYLSYGDRKILFLHGHQTDRLYNRNIGESLVFAMGWGIRGGLGSLYRRIAYIETMRHCRNMTFSGELKRIATEAQVNTVVMGHTHTAMIKNFDSNLLYLNSGHCAFGNTNFLSIDLKEDRFVVEKC